VADALRAAFVDVTFFGVFRSERALPAALFDFRDVDPLRSVADARDAARFPVCLDMPHLEVRVGARRATTLPDPCSCGQASVA